MNNSSSSKSSLCPICKKPTLEAYRPFCSTRCAQVDLGHWFGEAYTIPVATDNEIPPEPEEEPEKAED